MPNEQEKCNINMKMYRNEMLLGWKKGMSYKNLNMKKNPRYM